MDHGLDQGRGSEFFDDRSAVSRPENRGGFMMRKKLASLGMTVLLLAGLVATMPSCHLLEPTVFYLREKSIWSLTTFTHYKEKR
jgi:hypothetical protein